MGKIYACMMPFRTEKRNYLFGEIIGETEYSRLTKEQQSNFQWTTR